MRTAAAEGSVDDRDGQREPDIADDDAMERGEVRSAIQPPLNDAFYEERRHAQE